MTVEHPKRKKIRSPLQRAFMAWLEANRSAFKVPVRLGKRTEKCWDIHFDGIASAVSAALVGNGTQNELVIAAEWRGECWDLFVSFEASPYREGMFHFCALCDEGKRQAFDSPEELWIDHLFIPFLDWVNQRLAPARWLVLYGDGGFTSAELAVDRPEREDGQIILPLRLEQ